MIDQKCKPFIGGDIKVIVLGCDPTWDKLNDIKADKELCRKQDIKEDDYLHIAFGLCDEDLELANKVMGRKYKYIYNPFFAGIFSNLKEVGIDELNNIYACNLINYSLNRETTKYSKKNWVLKAKMEIERLKEELRGIDKNVPILITAQYLMDVLFPYEKYKFRDYYREDFNHEDTLPYHKELDRIIIPFSRNPRYLLSRYSQDKTHKMYEGYRDKIKQYIHERK